MEISPKGSPKERSVSPSERRKMIEDSIEDKPNGKKQKVIMDESDAIKI